MSADEVHRLQTGTDPECRLAQKVFEQGHYAGRTKPTNTRQGTYATAPSGVMLASANTNDPKRMAEMLRSALARWNAMSEAERMLGTNPADQRSAIARPESRYPKDGLALRVFSRDLPREKRAEDWRAGAWNQDYAWFTRDEARSLLPAKLEPGEKAAAPDSLVRRLARLNFVDNVRGQTSPYAPADISSARLEAEVLSVRGGIATIRFTGETKAERQGTWAISGFRDMNAPSAQRLGMSLRLYGTGSFDIASAKFSSFELIALGTRFGATQYNGRHDDTDPAPIGFLLVKAGDTASEQVAPAFYWSYGWR